MRCSECGSYAFGLRYCPRCHARMKQMPYHGRDEDLNLVRRYRQGGSRGPMIREEKWHK